jgi:hypothetical protein
VLCLTFRLFRDTDYANANKTSPMSWKETAGAYAAAVTTSCGIALSLKALAGTGKVPPLVRHLTPFTAVAAAGSVNVFLMRQKELW